MKAGKGSSDSFLAEGYILQAATKTQASKSRYKLVEACKPTDSRLHLATQTEISTRGGSIIDRPGHPNDLCCVMIEPLDPVDASNHPHHHDQSFRIVAWYDDLPSLTL